MTRSFKFLCGFVIVLFGDSCIDRIDADVDAVDVGILVVDGLITDQPGPYTVKIFRAFAADENLQNEVPFPVRRVTIMDDLGHKEDLTSDGNGIFTTKPDGIRGEIGRSYMLSIEGIDGTIYESTTEKILPPGEIEQVYFKWDQFKPLVGPTEYGFKIFLDANSNGSDSSFFRWKFSGVHEVRTFPASRLGNGGCAGQPNPPPCSGVVLTTRISGDFASVFLERVGDCTCCNCWNLNPEDKPTLSDKIQTDGSFKNIEIGYVPFDQWTFRYGTYMVKVEQISLTENGFEFWKIVRDQKDGATSLFQPAFGRIRTNLVSSNTDRKVTGVFTAAGVTQKVVFIKASDAQIPVPPPDIDPAENCFLWRTCNEAFPNASRTEPAEWEN